MSGAVEKYLLSVIAASMLLGLVQIILPKGSVRNVATFVGGLLVILSVLLPVADFDYDQLVRSVTNIQIETSDDIGIAINEELMADIIKEQCRTYILDKAKGLGAELEVEVVLSEKDVYPYPIAVVLRGKVTSDQKTQLSEYISRDLGIPVREQEWYLR